jgi:plant cysteine oxidase
VEQCEKLYSVRFERILELAKQTRPHQDPSAIPKIQALMDQLRPEDFQLKELMAELDRNRDWSTKSLFSEGDLHAGLFMVPKGHKIPLHDHPEMTVFFRVLWGRLKMRVYDWERRYPFEGLAHLRFDETLDGSNETLLVRPLDCNVHSIEALEDCAFVDLFAPPYNKEEGRICRNYREVGFLDREGERLMLLESTA